MNDGADGMLWRWLFPNVRRNERERFRFFALLAALIMVAQTVGLAGSDALFLAEVGPHALPGAFILASVVAVTSSLGYAVVVGRARNDRLFVWMLAGAAAALVAGAAAWFGGARWTLYAFFTVVYVTQAVFVNLHYPTLAADYFDTVSSKRVFPYLVGCSSAGGIVGGLLAVGLARVLPAGWLLVAWAGGLLAAALFLVVGRRDLRRWMPVGAEADEASTEGLLGALRFLRRSSLSRWLTTAIVGLVFALFLMQYLEMEIFASSFDSPEALASFIAIYLAVTNAVEILVAGVVSPILIRRLGIAQANLVHPILTIATFGVLAVAPTLASAVLARANRELLDNSLAAPIRALAYNALAFRFRGRMRAFLEGIVFYAAMSSAGLALLLIGGQLDPAMICAVGAAAAVVYLGANLRVRTEYLESIVDELRSGRLDLGEVGRELGDLEASRLAEQWEASLRTDATPARGWRELPALLASHGLRDPLRRNARVGHPSVRVACIEALADAPDAELDSILADALADPDPRVRRAAAEAVPAPDRRSAALAERLRERLDDVDLPIRARAAAALGADGLDTLRQMVAEGGDAAVAALPCVPDSLLPEARARLEDRTPAVRAAAIDCAVRLGDRPSLSLGRLEWDLADEEAVVRIAATRALAALRDPQVAPLIATALDDRSREVRAEASQALGRMGDAGVRAATSAVSSIRRWTADAALSAVAEEGGTEARGVLADAFRQRVKEAWQTRVATELVPVEDDVASRFLRVALEDAHARNTWVALRVLELVEDAAVVRSVEKALAYASPRDRADAVEVLSNLGEREPAAQLSLLFEDGALADKLAALPAALDLPLTFEQVVERARGARDRWLALAVRALDERALPRPTPDPRSTQEVRTMESLLALRRVPLFAHLSLEQLEAIGRFMKELRYLKGEVVVREGELGEDLYVMIEGEALAFKNYGTPDEVALTTMDPEGVCYFGEISIFDSAPRSATVVIQKDARLLRLGGDRFMELITQSPEISFEIFKVFTQRLRVAEERIRAQEDQARPPGSVPLPRSPSG